MQRLRRQLVAPVLALLTVRSHGEAMMISLVSFSLQLPDRVVAMQCTVGLQASVRLTIKRMCSVVYVGALHLSGINIVNRVSNDFSQIIAAQNKIHSKLLKYHIDTDCFQSLCARD